MADTEHDWNDRLDAFRVPGVLTSPGRYASAFGDLPSGIEELRATVQGLVVHEHLTGLYDVTLPPERVALVHTRPVERILERILDDDDRSLTEPREPAGRFVGNCRHYSVLFVAMLRAQGIPARARCGFGAYFAEGRFEDHWVAEYWDGAERRWRLVDAQIDARQRAEWGIGLDLTDVPRDRFLTSGAAWQLCRSDELDPARFGLQALGLSGWYWITDNLIRDVAALNNMELLPWDVWGAMTEPGESVPDDRAAWFDELAELSSGADVDTAELGRRYRADERLTVPDRVHNAVRDRMEPVLEP
ncbi:transglutaminase-like domain-containing protein [Glycomyces xiaoerkulensis]|uniref:transglutaminase-like domain-containing protein n=1 Tax=Glycomyces xiaoerkulensis TaxID=2038139 RepID=UPI0018E46485|nr:transglutaminase-like domain-containing protein [Glycomyces xiaoerkulensis]